MPRLHRLPRKHAVRGFTLLEMIVVLVIIGLIMGLVGPRLFGQADRAKVQTADTQVRMLRGAIQTMRLDTGRVPNQEEGLEMLVRPPSDPRISNRWQGPYLEEEVPLDPWGNPFQYSPTSSGSLPFSLYSLGADGQPGGEGNDADIGNPPDRQ
ncbi:type II secretion system major pseudopilin GspG [uncultured Luteimonas sp.]|uniref:type II secretion system major pseudopilin GspG n=1 Tax=uncultured Luteimonas sp. TaxID=453144 RepID=UPI002620ACAF|nr:type II secretion system major pseudopilin GspG [uncultured Luteimonas sp.]